MAEIRLIIDGREVSVPAGATILDAARKAGSYVPALCDHPDLKPIGSCKLCIVSVEGLDHYPTSCNTLAEEGMVVQTRTEELQEMRRHTLEMLLALTNHPTSCLFCDRKDECSDLRECMRKLPVTVGCKYCPKDGSCELQEAVEFVGLERIRYQLSFRNMPVLREPFFDRNYNLCIMCGRCVRICEEVRGNGVLYTHPDFHQMHWVGPVSLQDSDCKFCGACVDVCPTGALFVRADKWVRPESTVSTVCPYCGVGCRLVLGVKGGMIVSVSPDREGPVNHGQTCVKGRFGLDEIVHHPDRLTVPLIKRNGKFEEASWEEALDLVAKRFSEIKEKYGPNSLGAFSSSRCTNEENYLVQKLARAVFGTNNVDNCARVCHAPSVTGLAACFGSGAATNSFDQIEDADVLFIIGSNTTEAHPVVGLKVIKAANNGAKIIVADPRKIELVDRAKVWLNLKPGTNIALLNGMMNVILGEGLEDREFIASRTEGFEEFKKAVEGYPPEKAAEITGVPAEDIVEAARIYAGAEKAMIIYSLGMTEHVTGTANVMSLGNLAMLTGNVGRPSTGIMPLRGQNNVQGACDMGALPNNYVGYQLVTDPAVRAKFEEAWKVRLPEAPGLTSTQMLERLAEGGGEDEGIRGLYILGEDPAQTDPDTNRVRKSLAALDFLVVQEIFPTETTRYADVILPAASFAECDGTFTNGERRIQRVAKAISPLAGLENWETICLIAEKMGYPMAYGHPSEIMDEIAYLAPMFAGVNFERLGTAGLQWPCPSTDHPGTETMHVGKFSRGLGKFNAVEHRPPAEVTDPEYPLILTTGRRREHYNCGSMTRRSKGIMWVWPEETIEISPADAEEYGVEDGETVLVKSRRGEVRVKARVTDKSSRGVAFMSFHYQDVLTNLLTNAVLDPVARTPEYKACAIRIEKIPSVNGEAVSSSPTARPSSSSSP